MHAVGWRLWLGLFFFFFQAEDGIRDLYVTGVQTCALPILRLVIVGSDAWRAGEHRRLVALCGPGTRVVNSYGLTEATIRSEERRVGKECRSRWSPYH